MARKDNAGFWVYLTGVASEDTAILDSLNRRENAKCKICGSENVVKFGQLKGVQRWLCKDCRHKFADNKAFPGMKVAAEEIAWALCLYYEGIRFKEICRHLQQTYNSYPSDSTVYGWIDRFTKKALEAERKNIPNVGDIWTAITTPVKIGGEPHWFWDILDAGSRFMLASHISGEMNAYHAGVALAAATRKAGKLPRKILTDQIDVYFAHLGLTNDGEGKPVLAGRELTISDSQLLEEHRATLKARTAVMKRFRNLESARDFIEAWPMHYNYFRPHEIINNRTPAFRAGITSPLKIKLP